MSDTSYLISEAARRAGVETHVLRYWEEELQLPIARNKMGHRYYTKQDIQIFLSIKELKRRGFQLKTIKELVPKLAESAHTGTVLSQASRSGTEQKRKSQEQPEVQPKEVKKPDQFKDKLKKSKVQPLEDYKVQPETPERPNIKVLVHRKEAVQAEGKPVQPDIKVVEKKQTEQKQEPVKAAEDQKKQKLENNGEKKQQVNQLHKERQTEFYQILERLFQQLSGTEHSEERYKRLDAAIRKHQYSRRLVAATEEQGKKRKKKYK